MVVPTVRDPSSAEDLKDIPSSRLPYEKRLLLICTTPPRRRVDIHGICPSDPRLSRMIKSERLDQEEEPSLPTPPVSADFSRSSASSTLVPTPNWNSNCNSNSKMNSRSTSISRNSSSTSSGCRSQDLDQNHNQVPLEPMTYGVKKEILDVLDDYDNGDQHEEWIVNNPRHDDKVEMKREEIVVQVPEECRPVITQESSEDQQNRTEPVAILERSAEGVKVVTSAVNDIFNGFWQNQWVYKKKKKFKVKPLAPDFQIQKVIPSEAPAPEERVPNFFGSVVINPLSQDAKMKLYIKEEKDDNCKPLTSKIDDYRERKAYFAEKKRLQEKRREMDERKLEILAERQRKEEAERQRKKESGPQRKEVSKRRAIKILEEDRKVKNPHALSSGEHHLKDENKALVENVVRNLKKSSSSFRVDEPLLDTRRSFLNSTSAVQALIADKKRNINERFSAFFCVNYDHKSQQDSDLSVSYSRRSDRKDDLITGSTSSSSAMDADTGSADMEISSSEEEGEIMSEERKERLKARHQRFQENSQFPDSNRVPNLNHLGSSSDNQVLNLVQIPLPNIPVPFPNDPRLLRPPLPPPLPPDMLVPPPPPPPPPPENLSSQSVWGATKFSSRSETRDRVVLNSAHYRIKKKTSESSSAPIQRVTTDPEPKQIRGILKKRAEDDLGIREKKRSSKDSSSKSTLKQKRKKEETKRKEAEKRPKVVEGEVATRKKSRSEERRKRKLLEEEAKRKKRKVEDPQESPRTQEDADLQVPKAPVLDKILVRIDLEKIDCSVLVKRERIEEEEDRNLSEIEFNLSDDNSSGPEDDIQTVIKGELDVKPEMLDDLEFDVKRERSETPEDVKPKMEDQTDVDTDIENEEEEEEDVKVPVSEILRQTVLENGRGKKGRIRDSYDSGVYESPSGFVKDEVEDSIDIEEHKIEIEPTSATENVASPVTDEFGSVSDVRVKRELIQDSEGSELVFNPIRIKEEPVLEEEIQEDRQEGEENVEEKVDIEDLVCDNVDPLALPVKEEPSSTDPDNRDILESSDIKQEIPIPVENSSPEISSNSRLIQDQNCDLEVPGVPEAMEQELQLPKVEDSLENTARWILESPASPEAKTRSEGILQDEGVEIQDTVVEAEEEELFVEFETETETRTKMEVKPETIQKLLESVATNGEEAVPESREEDARSDISCASTVIKSESDPTARAEDSGNPVKAEVPEETPAGEEKRGQKEEDANSEFSCASTVFKSESECNEESIDIKDEIIESAPANSGTIQVDIPVIKVEKNTENEETPKQSNENENIQVSQDAGVESGTTRDVPVTESSRGETGSPAEEAPGEPILKEPKIEQDKAPEDIQVVPKPEPKSEPEPENSRESGENTEAASGETEPTATPDSPQNSSSQREGDSNGKPDTPKMEKMETQESEDLPPLFSTNTSTQCPISSSRNTLQVQEIEKVPAGSTPEAVTNSTGVTETENQTNTVGRIRVRSFGVCDQPAEEAAGNPERLEIPNPPEIASPSSSSSSSSLQKNPDPEPAKSSLPKLRVRLPHELGSRWCPTPLANPPVAPPPALNSEPQYPSSTFAEPSHSSFINPQPKPSTVVLLTPQPPLPASVPAPASNYISGTEPSRYIVSNAHGQPMPGLINVRNSSSSIPPVQGGMPLGPQFQPFVATTNSNSNSNSNSTCGLQGHQTMASTERSRITAANVQEVSRILRHIYRHTVFLYNTARRFSAGELQQELQHLVGEISSTREKLRALFWKLAKLMSYQDHEFPRVVDFVVRIISREVPALKACVTRDYFMRAIGYVGQRQGQEQGQRQGQVLVPGQETTTRRSSEPQNNFTAQQLQILQHQMHFYSESVKYYYIHHQINETRRMYSRLLQKQADDSINRVTEALRQRDEAARRHFPNVVQDNPGRTVLDSRIPMQQPPFPGDARFHETPPTERSSNFPRPSGTSQPSSNNYGICRPGNAYPQNVDSRLPPAGSARAPVLEGPGRFPVQGSSWQNTNGTPPREATGFNGSPVRENLMEARLNVPNRSMVITEPTRESSPARTSPGGGFIRESSFVGTNCAPISENNNINNSLPAAPVPSSNRENLESEQNSAAIATSSMGTSSYEEFEPEVETNVKVDEEDSIDIKDEYIDLNNMLENKNIQEEFLETIKVEFEKIKVEKDENGDEDDVKILDEIIHLSNSAGSRIPESTVEDDANVNRCVNCNKISEVSCSQCLDTSYCGRECQEKHWVKEHHLVCKPKLVNNRTLRS